MQARTEMCGLKWVHEVVRKQGIRAVRTTRDDSPFTYSLYLSAAVTSHFLRTTTGAELLRQGDVRSHSLMAAAIANHKASDAGAILAYVFCLIRNFHPTGPGSLRNWGRPHNRPPPNSDRALQAFCTFVGAAAEGQKSFYSTLQLQHPGVGFQWKDLLETAYLRVHDEMEIATMAVDRPDLSHATVTLSVDRSMNAANEQSLATKQEDLPSSVVDVCRYGLNMSRSELLGMGCANLESRIRQSLDAFKLNNIQMKARYPLRRQDKEYQVRCT